MFEISQILLPVEDIDASLLFYSEILGLPVGIRDGDRYATLKAGAVKIALAAPEERRRERGAGAAFKVKTLDVVIERLRERGIQVPPVLEGAHERTLEVTDPDGHAVLFYEPKG